MANDAPFTEEEEIDATDAPALAEEDFSGIVKLEIAVSDHVLDHIKRQLLGQQPEDALPDQVLQNSGILSR